MEVLPTAEKVNGSPGHIISKGQALHMPDTTGFSGSGLLRILYQLKFLLAPKVCA
jgi:hypothetical protein